jgi:hypothetical protein
MVFTSFSIFSESPQLLIPRTNLKSQSRFFPNVQGISLAGERLNRAALFLDENLLRVELFPQGANLGL